jgi:hypothetical protein
VTDAELTHRRAGGLEGEEVAGKPGRVLRFGKDRPGECLGVGRGHAAVFYGEHIPGKDAHDFIVRSAGSEVPAADLFYIHCKSGRCRTR